jgi:glutathione S-transferase
MKLYFSPRTRATRARWLLEELEVPYELVKLDQAKREHEAPEHLSLHPFGGVPVLVDGDVTLFESLAIALYLADSVPSKNLAPAVGAPERGRYLQWLVFAETRLEVAVLQFFQYAQLSEAQKPTAEQHEQFAQHRAQLQAVLHVVDAELNGREFLAAGHFTAADLVMASILHLAHALKLLDAHPRLVDYLFLHCKRPACAKAVAP